MLTLYGQGGLAELPTQEEFNIIAQVVARGTVEFTATVATGNAQLTATSDLTGVAVGDHITGTGIPSGAFVTVVDNTAHTLTINVNATASAVGATFVDMAGEGGLEGCVVVLYTNILSPPFKDITIASLTMATFDGYAPSSAVVWGSVIEDPGTGNCFVTGDKKAFIMTGTTTPNTIIGAALVDAALTSVYQVDQFVNPINLAGVSQGFDYVPLFSID